MPKIIRFQDNKDMAVRLCITTGTDPRLYDHPLTIVLPRGVWRDPLALQDGHPISNLKFAGDKLLVEVRPFSSTVVIQDKMP